MLSFSQMRRSTAVLLKQRKRDLEEKLSKDNVRSLLQKEQVGLGGNEPLIARGEANRK